VEELISLSNWGDKLETGKKLMEAKVKKFIEDMVPITYEFCLIHGSE